MWWSNNRNEKVALLMFRSYFGKNLLPRPGRLSDTEVLRAFYISNLCTQRNRVDLSCVLLILKSVMLYTRSFAQIEFRKQHPLHKYISKKERPNLALFSSTPTPQLIYLHGSNLFNPVSQRYSTKRSHPRISPTVKFLPLRRHRRYCRKAKPQYFPCSQAQVKHATNDSAQMKGQHYSHDHLAVRKLQLTRIDRKRCL